MNPLKTVFGKSKKNSGAKPIASIQVELTNHCNYKCPFCPQSHWRLSQYSDTPFDRSKGFMDFDLYRKIINEANDIAHEVNFSFFGEPMLHPEFMKFMAYLKSRSPDLNVVMNTNLSRATQIVFQKLIEIEFTELRISIDAATAETYNKVRPGSNSLNLDGSSVMENRFDAICQKAEYWFSMPNHRPTRHVFTVNSKNLAEIGTFVQRWLPLLGDNDTILTKSVLTYGGKITDTFIHENPCNAWDMNMLTVDWTGKVSPCNLDTNMDLCIGSVLENSLLKLHQNRKRQELECLSKTKQIKPCRTCIDANNWSKNIIFRKGDAWNDKYVEKYEKTNQDNKSGNDNPCSQIVT